MNSHISTEDINDLRDQLMEALDSLNDVEHRIQEARHAVKKTRKIVDTIRSWQVEESEPQPVSVTPKPANLPDVKFLSIAEIAVRWGCCTRTVKRMIKSDALVRTYLGKRTIRIAIEEIERYEVDCRS